MKIFLSPFSYRFDLFALFLTAFATALLTTAFAALLAISLATTLNNGWPFPFAGAVFFFAATVFFFAVTFEAFFAAPFVETAFFAATFTGAFFVPFFFARLAPRRSVRLTRQFGNRSTRSTATSPWRSCSDDHSPRFPISIVIALAAAGPASSASAIVLVSRYLLKPTSAS